MATVDSYSVAMAQILVEGGRAEANLDRAVGAIAQAAEMAARKGNLGPAAMDDVRFRLDALRKSREAFAAVKPAVDRLKAIPDDPEANLAVGKFRCFVQGRWADGLKVLAEGSHPALKYLSTYVPTGKFADCRRADQGP